MKKFLAIYTGTISAQERSGWDNLSKSEQDKRAQDGIKAWIAWGEKHKDAIVEQGSPLGKTKRTGPGGVSDIKNALAGYTIVQAASHEVAAKLFERHPHFTIFPGDSVEIMECLPLPQM